MNKDSVWERRADAERGSEQMRVVCPPAGLTDSASKWVCSMPSAMLSYAPIPNCCGLGVGLGGREGTWKCFVPTCWKMPSALHQPANPSKSILLGSQTLSHMYGASITKVWAVWEHFCILFHVIRPWDILLPWSLQLFSLMPWNIEFWGIVFDLNLLLLVYNDFNLFSPCYLGHSLSPTTWADRWSPNYHPVPSCLNAVKTVPCWWLALSCVLHLF